MLQQAGREGLGALALRHLDPEVHGRLAACDPQPAAREDAEQDLTLAAIGLAGALDVRLVVPGDDGRALDEFLRDRAHCRPERPQQRDQLGRRSDESRPIAGHRRPLAQGVEDDDVPPLRDLEGRRRSGLEPELAVRLVRGDEKVVLEGQLREALVEFERS